MRSFSEMSFGELFSFFFRAIPALVIAQVVWLVLIGAVAAFVSLAVMMFGFLLGMLGLVAGAGM